MNIITLKRGSLYPLSFVHKESANADFLRKSGNRLVIYLPNMGAKEEKALRTGVIKAGLLHDGPAMLWLFQIFNNKGPLLSFDAPFDARLIDQNDRQLYDIYNANQRLLIELHAVDEKGILRALRALTLPPDLTLEFLSAVQDQIVAPCTGDEKMNEWMQFEPRELITKTKNWVLGK